jgi:hypothetical protein
VGVVQDETCFVSIVGFIQRRGDAAGKHQQRSGGEEKAAVERHGRLVPDFP